MDSSTRLWLVSLFLGVNMLNPLMDDVVFAVVVAYARLNPDTMEQCEGAYELQKALDNLAAAYKVRTNNDHEQDGD